MKLLMILVIGFILGIVTYNIIQEEELEEREKRIEELEERYSNKDLLKKEKRK